MLRLSSFGTDLRSPNLGTEEVVDLSDSPLWQLELRDQTNREQRMLLPSDEDLAETSPPWRPIDTVSMTHIRLTTLSSLAA